MVAPGRVAVCKTRKEDELMASLRLEIGKLLANDVTLKMTNAQLAEALAKPEPSVRRATLDALGRGDVIEVGKTFYGAYIYQSANALSDGGVL